MDEIFTAAQAKDMLEHVIAWLNSTDESDQRWQGETGHVKSCLNSMRAKVEQPLHPAYQGHVPKPSPDVILMKNAVRDVDGMLMAMNRRQRERAIEAGNAAVAKLA
jgi:hypothetical protein